MTLMSTRIILMLMSNIMVGMNRDILLSRYYCSMPSMRLSLLMVSKNSFIFTSGPNHIAMAKTAEEVEAERAHVCSRIEYCLSRLQDPDRRYTIEDRSELINRMYDYAARMLKVPVSQDKDIKAITQDLAKKVDSFLTSDLADIRAGAKDMAGMLRQHRVRVRKILN